MSDNKKIGVLTLLRSNNYGAMLQAYALSKFLCELGYEPFIVNYHMESASVRTYLTQPLVFLAKVAGKSALSWNFIRSKVSDWKGKSSEGEFTRIFEKFREEHLRITKQVYNYESLKSDPPEAYAFVVGSDQVWAADFVFSSPVFLLGFVGKDVKKISYAASFGKAELERYLQPVFKIHITDFDAVSVREKSGVDLIRNLANFDATHVVDPTLLLTDYSEIIDYSLVPEGEYMFSYRLGQSEELTRWMNETLDAIGASESLPHYVVSTNSAKSTITSGEALQPTPGQLLGLIERANLFATNSFHGTVFALLLRTRFLTFARDSASDKQNLRLTELLSTLGMDDRYCAPVLGQSEVLEKSAAPCRFDKAFETLADRRDASAAFIEHALQE
jgi:hypothetical protein